MQVIYSRYSLLFSVGDGNWNIDFVNEKKTSEHLYGDSRWLWPHGNQSQQGIGTGPNHR
jgi:hypothetical protein